jgi:hypothetical protein
MPKMTNEQLIAEMQSDSLLNQIRKEFSFGYANIEQACAQRQKPGIIEIRQMEFDVAQKILDMVQQEPLPKDTTRFKTLSSVDDE